MRWDNLFADLETQLESGAGAEGHLLKLEEERLRIARLTLRDRLELLIDSGAEPRIIRFVLSGGLRVALLPTTMGRDWIAGDLPDGGAGCVIPLPAVVQILLEKPDPRVGAPPPTADGSRANLARGVDLPVVLRDLCRRRREVEVLCHGADGQGADPLGGTIDSVSSDHFELAVHDRGVPRRESAVRSHRIVALTQLLLLRY